MIGSVDNNGDDNNNNKKPSESHSKRNKRNKIKMKNDPEYLRLEQSI